MPVPDPSSFDPDPPTVAGLRFPVGGSRSEGLADAEIRQKLLDELEERFTRSLGELERETHIAVLRRAVDSAMGANREFRPVPSSDESFLRHPPTVRSLVRPSGAR